MCLRGISSTDLLIESATGRESLQETHLGGEWFMVVVPLLTGAQCVETDTVYPEDYLTLEDGGQVM